MLRTVPLFTPPPMTSKLCPFCNMPADRIVDRDEHVMVIRDGFPVTEGHTLIIPHRHVGSYFQATPEEHRSIEAMLLKHRALLSEKLDVHDFNIGINDGPLAGQTVSHLHVHLIPRRRGDMEDPRGGVRYVIPEKAKYW